MSSEDEQSSEGRYCSLAGWIPCSSVLFLFLYFTDHEHEEKDKKITGVNIRTEANQSSNGPMRIDRNLSPPF